MDECSVLLVDDEAAILEGYEKLVRWKELRCKVTGTAMDGEEAIRKAKELLPDIIIMDINLPKISGLEAIRGILDGMKKSTPVYVLVVTGYDDFSYCQEALRLHVSDFLLKPLDFEEFEEIIKKTVTKIMEDPASRIRRSQTLERIIGYMKENISDTDMRLSSMAEHLGLNPAYISQLFKKELGCGYHSYLNELRVEKAKELLIKTDDPITEIAIKVGIADYRVFTKVFKTSAGETPSQFRKMDS